MRVTHKPKFLRVPVGELESRFEFRQHVGLVGRTKLENRWADIVLGVVFSHKERIAFGLGDYVVGKIFFPTSRQAIDKITSLNGGGRYLFPKSLAPEIVRDKKLRTLLLEQGILYFWEEITPDLDRFILRSVERNEQVVDDRRGEIQMRAALVPVKILLKE